jgi:GT2 family glycosyltransferase
MRIVVLDSTIVPGVFEGPGAPAYFSSAIIQRLRARHEVIVLPEFDKEFCQKADLVWTEWATDDAREAAASGACRRLIVRMRGFDVWGDLGSFNWDAVELLVYESEILKKLAEDRAPFLKNRRTLVQASGIDLGSRFKERSAGGAVAVLSRADYRKGHQLICEWARRRPDVPIHTTLTLWQHNPRLSIYLEEKAPPNLHITPHVTDVRAWLDEIGASYILSASIWEDLGYGVAEGMSMGLKPLIHAFPNAEMIWPKEWLWESFDELDALHAGPVEFDRYRAFVEERYDADKQAEKFEAILTEERPGSALGDEQHWSEVPIVTVAQRPQAVPHVLAMLTAPRGTPTRPQALASLEAAGSARWTGPKLLVCDGFRPHEVPAGWTVDATETSVGSTQSFMRLVRRVVTEHPGAHLTFVEDDVLLCKNALDYIAAAELPPVAPIASWYSRGAQARPGTGWAIVPVAWIPGGVALTFTPAALAQLVAAADQRTDVQVARNAHDVFVGVALAGKFMAVHVPSLAQHNGLESAVGNTDLGLRASPTFPGEHVDALAFVPGAERDLGVNLVPVEHAQPSGTDAIVVLTAPRPLGETLTRALASLDAAGAREWTGPKILVCDGSIDVPASALAAGWEARPAHNGASIGGVASVVGAFRQALADYPNLRTLTLFEDDVVLCRGALDYMRTTKIPDDVAFLSWFSLMGNAADVTGLALMPSEMLSGAQGVTLSAEAVRAVVESGADKMVPASSNDGLLKRTFAGKRIGVHMPSLVQHTGGLVSSIGLEHMGAREAPSFPGEDYEIRPAVTKALPQRTIVTLSKYPEHLRQLCRSIRATGEKAEIVVVVDEGFRADGVPEGFAPIRLVEGAPKFNFARNANIGIAACPPDHDVFLVNDDVQIVTPGGLDRLAETAARDGVGVVAPHLLGPGGNLRRVHRALGDVKPLNGCFGWAAVYLSRKVLDKIGGLDERFDGYGMEDDDYNYRVFTAGLQNYVDGRCVAQHVSGATFNKVYTRPAFLDAAKRSHEKFAAKWGDNGIMWRSIAFVMDCFHDALALISPSQDLNRATASVMSFRSAFTDPGLGDERAWLAVELAKAYSDKDLFTEAKLWALRALSDGPRPDALAILGDIAEVKGDLIGARNWYEAASAMGRPNVRYADAELIGKRRGRLYGIRKAFGDLMAESGVGVVDKRPPKPTARPRTIVTLSRFPDTLVSLLESVRRAGEDCEIVVADDGLPPELDLSAYGAVRRVPCPRPFNFARNANIGIAACPPDHDVFLVNDDARLLTHRGLDHLAETASQAGVGIVSTGVLSSEVNEWQQMVDGEIVDMRDQGVAFIAVYLSRQVREAVGQLDESFDGHGWEDGDYSVRSRRAGLKNMVDGRCVVDHIRLSTSFVRVFGDKGYAEAHERAHARYKEKWGELPPAQT